MTHKLRVILITSRAVFERNSVAVDFVACFAFGLDFVAFDCSDDCYLFLPLHLAYYHYDQLFQTVHPYPDHLNHCVPDYSEMGSCFSFSLVSKIEMSKLSRNYKSTCSSRRGLFCGAGLSS